jgi:4-diphosphocytidyl-2-C-methyl-D-erythritol kinase
MRAITIPAFAKANLQLHIVGRRPDGYHELRTVFQTISLHDRLTLSVTRGRGIELECSDPGLPTGRGNLVWRALDALRRELKLRSGIHARLDKWIPAGRGLGGGSSDAAAALVGLLRLTGRQLPHDRLLEIAAGLGADVPFFLLGGRALGVGRGDEIYPLADIPAQTVLVVSPAGISVPTKDAYAWVSRRMGKGAASSAPATKRRLTKRAAAPKLLRFCALCWSSQGGPLVNDFEPAVFAKHPRLGRIKRDLLRVGATEAALAGSGSAVFGVFPNPAQARRAALLFPNDQVFLAETVSRIRYRKALGLSTRDG